MNPLKRGRFDIHFHRRDAEHAEDLFNFLLSAVRPADTLMTLLSLGAPGSRGRIGRIQGESAAYLVFIR